MEAADGELAVTGHGPVLARRLGWLHQSSIAE